ncbi:MAG: LamG-like jellyroll fold domain-containing protein, partial [Myxococcota bacterium]
MWWTIPARAATGEPQTRIQLVGVPEVPVHELILPVAVPAANGGGTFVDARGQVLTAEREGGPGEDDLWWVRLPDAPPEAAVWWRPGASNAHLPWEPYRWVHHMDGRRAAWGAPLSGPAGVVGAGKFGRAQFLDGQHADVGPLGTHTFSAWVIVDPGITTPLVAHAAWVLTVEPSGVAALELGGTRSTGLVPLTDGEWHHLAVTVRPGHAALFVDGAREATADVDATAGSYGVLWFG